MEAYQGPKVARFRASVLIIVIAEEFPIFHVHQLPAPSNVWPQYYNQNAWRRQDIIM
jgi:hypothetical protein